MKQIKCKDCNNTKFNVFELVEDIIFTCPLCEQNNGSFREEK